MKTSWNKGLNAQQKEELRKDFILAYPVRERLKTMLLSDIETSRADARSKNSYDSPSWALMQADALGYERALSYVISLLTDEKVQKQTEK